MKKSVSSSHHGPTVVLPTIRSGLLRAAIKVSTAVTFHFPSHSSSTSTLSPSTSLFLSLNLPSLNLKFLTHFFPFSLHFHSKSSFSLNLSLSRINFISFPHFFSKFISLSPLLHNHLLLSPILPHLSLKIFIFPSQTLFLRLLFQFSYILQPWHLSRGKGASRRQGRLAKHHSNLNKPPILSPMHRPKVIFLIPLV